MTTLSVIRRIEGRWCGCCVLIYLNFSLSFFELSLGMLSANFEQSPSFLRVSVKSAWSFLWAYIRLSLLRACFILLWTLPKLSFAYKLPAGLHLALLQASFELASSIPLSFLQAYLQLPSGLSLRSLWALPQNCLKLAWSFLQACFMFPSGLFRLPASFLEFAFRFLQLASNMLPACFMLPPSCLWASLELALSLF